MVCSLLPPCVSWGLNWLIRVDCRYLYPLSPLDGPWAPLSCMLLKEIACLWQSLSACQLCLSVLTACYTFVPRATYPGEQTWLFSKGMDIETQGRSCLLLSEPMGCSLDFGCAPPYRNGDSELVSPLWWGETSILALFWPSVVDLVSTPALNINWSTTERNVHLKIQRCKLALW